MAPSLAPLARSTTRRLVLASSFSVYGWSAIRGTLTEESPLETDLYRRDGAYEYSRGFNWVAIGALALGVLPSLPGFVAVLRGVPETGLFGTIYNWAWFVGFLLAALIYVIGMQVRAGSRVRGAVSVST